MAPDKDKQDWDEATKGVRPLGKTGKISTEQPKVYRTHRRADNDFTPDVTLRDGDVIKGAGWTLEAIHTPGHTSNHLCYALAEERALFSGDHVMGWSTTVVSPPDGDMADYMASLARLGARAETTFWPTHGPSIEAPGAFVAAPIAHRQAREEQILKCLEDGVGNIPDMVRRIGKGRQRTLGSHRVQGLRLGQAHLMHDVAHLDQGAYQRNAERTTQCHLQIE